MSGVISYQQFGKSGVLGDTPANITDSFNVSSVTFVETGSYTVNTTVTQTNASSKTASGGFYGCNIELENNTSGSSFGLVAKDINGLSMRNPDICCVTIFGD